MEEGGRATAAAASPPRWGVPFRGGICGGGGIDGVRGEPEAAAAFAAFGAALELFAALAALELFKLAAKWDDSDMLIKRRKETRSQKGDESSGVSSRGKKKVLLLLVLRPSFVEREQKKTVVDWISKQESFFPPEFLHA